MTSQNEEKVIDLVSSDDDSNAKSEKQSVQQESTERSTRKRKLSEDYSNKRSRTNTDQQGRSWIDSRIRLFATVQDEKVRSAHSTEQATHPAWTQCKTLREVLGYDDQDVAYGTPEWIVVSNYIIDFGFLLDEVPELVSIPQATVFYGIPESNGAVWTNSATAGAVDLRELRPSDPPGKTNPLKFKIRFGVHHSKFFLIGFPGDILRVVIHTANLRYSDIHLKAQALFYQDFSKKTVQHGCSTPFERDLVSYLETYNYGARRRWSCAEEKTITLVECVKRYDFATARVQLVSSTPGYHALRGEPANLRGYLKARHAIHQHCKSQENLSSSPIVCQFSSMGSLSEKYLRDFHHALDVKSALVETPKLQSSFLGQKPMKQKLKLVFPTVEEVRVSVEGYRGGESVPVPKKNLQKPCLAGLFHHWSSPTDERNPLLKPNNVPHIKTYYQSTTEAGMRSFAWLIVSSHNLSKAAWGEVQYSKFHGEQRLFARHWELGVFLSPSLLDCNSMVTWDQMKPHDESQALIPLPYSLDSAAYGNDDVPWAVNLSYGKPDWCGRTSCREY